LWVEGGQAGELVKVGVPVGTVVRVEDLFYNVPARLKFMKSDRTEKRQIDNLVTRYALAYPEVRFRLQQDERVVLRTNGAGDYREALAALFGPDIARQMMEVIAQEDDLGIRGYISPTTLTRGTRRDILFFVNGRPIRDIALTTAMVKAYRTLLMVGRFPMAVLFLDIPPEAVDVNVHPTKAEVRFKEPNRIFTSIQSAVRRALLAHTPVPELGGSLRWSQPSTPTSPSYAETLWGIEKRQEMEVRPKEDRDETEVPPNDIPAMESTQLSGLKPPLLRLVGQVATAYLIAEGPDGLYLIDQHAAHERVLFERFMSQRKETIPSQTLLQPVTVELSPANTRLLEEQLPALNRLGFVVESFGPGTFLVRALPSLLSNMDPAAAIQVLVEDFEEDETPLQAEVEAKVIARVCKRAAVKAGQSLSTEEQRALLDDLEACEAPRTCPHGRPTMIHLSVEVLERQFGRRGAR
jgi:DNA mismatch repair protein MutL